MVKADGLDIADGLVRDFVPRACRRPFGRHRLSVELDRALAVVGREVFEKERHDALVHRRLFDETDKGFLAELVLPLRAVEDLPLARRFGEPFRAKLLLFCRKCHRASLKANVARRTQEARRAG